MLKKEEGIRNRMNNLLKRVGICAFEITLALGSLVGCSIIRPEKPVVRERIYMGYKLRLEKQKVGNLFTVYNEHTGEFIIGGRDKNGDGTIEYTFGFTDRPIWDDRNELKNPENLNKLYLQFFTIPKDL